MNKLLTLSALTVASANVHDRAFYEEKFYDWMQEFKHNVKNGTDFLHQLQNFANNQDIIEKHNSEQSSYILGHNEYSYMSLAEFQDSRNFGFIPNSDDEKADLIHEAPTDLSALPSSVDWSTQGKVTPVKNQGNCGSCWSFSATGALEGAYSIKFNDLQSFSEQELVSCDTGGLSGDHGCNGGLMDNAFKWVKNNGGLCSESAYPYTSGTNGQNGSCKSHTSCDNKNLKVISYTDVTKNSDSALMSALAQQPVSVAIQADQQAFQLYKSGVLTGTCGSNLNHGVLAVGYGKYTDGTDYYKVKNSWGVSWGMQGYVLIQRGASQSGGKCGILNGPPSYPNL